MAFLGYQETEVGLKEKYCSVCKDKKCGDCKIQIQEIRR